jgi:hypothetical protein
MIKFNVYMFNFVVRGLWFDHYMLYQAVLKNGALWVQSTGSKSTMILFIYTIINRVSPLKFSSNLMQKVAFVSTITNVSKGPGKFRSF